MDLIEECVEKWCFNRAINEEVRVILQWLIWMFLCGSQVFDCSNLLVGHKNFTEKNATLVFQACLCAAVGFRLFELMSYN